MTESFKIIIPCLRLIMKQKAKVPMLSITMQGAADPGHRLILLFYCSTVKLARGTKVTQTASKSHEIFKTYKSCYPLLFLF